MLGLDEPFVGPLLSQHFHSMDEAVAERDEDGVPRHAQSEPELVRALGVACGQLGHLSEYVPWYRKRPREIRKWIDLGSWINGETGGYLRVCTEGRNWFETDFPNWLQEEPPVIAADRRSEEHGSFIGSAAVMAAGSKPPEAPPGR